MLKRLVLLLLIGLLGFVVSAQPELMTSWHYHLVASRGPVISNWEDRPYLQGTSSIQGTYCIIRHIPYAPPPEVEKAILEGCDRAYKELVIVRGFRFPFLKAEFTLMWFGDPIVPPVPPETLVLYKSVGAHEFFHAIQIKGYMLLGAGRTFLESTAVWAQREVVPECVWCYTYFFLELMLGSTDVIDLKGRLGYELGLFWNWLADSYGGAALIKRVLEEASPLFGGPREWTEAVEAAFAERGKSFLDLWAEFALAIAARQVPDADYLYPKAEGFSHLVPVPSFVGSWEGLPMIIDRVNWENPYPELIKKLNPFWWLILRRIRVAAVGDPLEVAHEYGIDFIRIIPNSSLPLLIKLEGEEDTHFRAFIVAEARDGAITVLPLEVQRPVLLEEPGAYGVIHIVITRGLEGRGRYRLVLLSSEP